MKRILAFLVSCISILLIIFLLLIFNKINKKPVDNNIYMEDLSNYTIEQIKEYSNTNELNLTIKEEYDNKIKKDDFISQSIPVNEIVKKGDNLEIVISKGIDYEKYSVNELGNIPVMMYHQIKNMKNE